jgi:hypothetical protein
VFVKLFIDAFTCIGLCSAVIILLPSIVDPVFPCKLIVLEASGHIAIRVFFEH